MFIVRNLISECCADFIGGRVECFLHSSFYYLLCANIWYTLLFAIIQRKAFRFLLLSVLRVFLVCGYFICLSVVCCAFGVFLLLFALRFVLELMLWGLACFLLFCNDLIVVVLLDGVVWRVIEHVTIPTKHMRQTTKQQHLCTVPQSNKRRTLTQQPQNTSDRWTCHFVGLASCAWYQQTTNTS